MQAFSSRTACGSVKEWGRAELRSFPFIWSVLTLSPGLQSNLWKGRQSGLGTLDVNHLLLENLSLLLPLRDPFPPSPYPAQQLRAKPALSWAI